MNPMERAVARSARAANEADRLAGLPEPYPGGLVPHTNREGATEMVSPATAEVRYAAVAWQEAGSPEEGPEAERYRSAFDAYKAERSGGVR